MATRFCSVIALSLSIAASSIGLATDISFPLVWRKTCTKGGKDHSFFRFSLKSVVSWHLSMTFFGCFTLAHTATSRKPRTWHGPGIFTRAEAAPLEGLQLFFPGGGWELKGSVTPVPKKTAWWVETWLLWLSIYWEQSSQLTSIFFRGVCQPPTSKTSEAGQNNDSCSAFDQRKGWICRDSPLLRWVWERWEPCCCWAFHQLSWNVPRNVAKCSKPKLASPAPSCDLQYFCSKFMWADNG